MKQNIFKMEVTGKIKHLYDTQTYGANGFKKRELVLETVEQYPQFLKIEFVQEKCDVLNSYQVGQEVKIGINLKGREWINPENQTVYFNSIQGWRVDPLQNAVATTPETANAQAPAQTASVNDSEPDDLPF